MVDPSSVDSDSFGGRAAGTREDAGVPDAQVAVLQASTLPASFSDSSEMDVLGRSSVLIPRALGLCGVRKAPPLQALAHHGAGAFPCSRCKKEKAAWQTRSSALSSGGSLRALCAALWVLFRPSSNCACAIACGLH